MEVLGGLGVGILILVVFCAIWMAVSCYQKCGPNEAMVISGGGLNEYKVVVGGGSVVWPMIQQKDYLTLEVMPIDVRSPAPIITKNGVPIYVDGVAQIKVQGDDESIRTAAEQFLGKDNHQIAEIAHETLLGHLRAILGTMEVDTLIQNFDEFTSRVQEHSVSDLRKMGLSVVSFTIKEVRDEVGYLDSLGRKRTATAKRDADIGVAEAERETQIAQANAQRDAQMAKADAQAESQSAQARAAEKGAKAKIIADTNIAEATRDFQVKQAQFQASVSKEKAASDMEYDIVKATTQQKLVEETQKIKIVEAQKQVELEMVEVQKREVELAAEITKPAEAEQSRIRIHAQAEQEKRTILAKADADAAKLQADGQAAARRAAAAAEADATKATGLAEAEANRARGIAEAQVIQAKGEAEADAMAKKAEAFKQYNDAAMASMVVDKLPDLVEAAAGPLSKIGSMTVLATGGDSTGPSKITGDVMNVAAQGMTMVKGLTGIDLSNYMRKQIEGDKQS